MNSIYQILGPEGFEPSTTALSTQHSNRLSYDPYLALPFRDTMQPPLIYL
jgi:hypothetical protein